MKIKIVYLLCIIIITSMLVFAFNCWNADCSVNIEEANMKIVLFKRLIEQNKN